MQKTVWYCFPWRQEKNEKILGNLVISESDLSCYRILFENFSFKKSCLKASIIYLLPRYNVSAVFFPASPVQKGSWLFVLARVFPVDAVNVKYSILRSWDLHWRIFFYLYLLPWLNCSEDLETSFVTWFSLKNDNSLIPRALEGL